MEKVGKLAGVLSQYETASAPVVAHLYASEPQLAQEELRERIGEAASTTAEAGELEALLLKLNYLAYQVEKAASPLENHKETFARAYATLSAGTSTALGSLMQSVVLIELLSHAERNGWLEFPRERMYGLLAGVPNEERDPELWFYIASWAFGHSDVELLEEAYEIFLLQPTEFVDQYPYQRVKLMHRLLTGGLTATEVADFLGRLSVLPEALEFERYIWPRIVEAGLSSHGLEDLLQTTIAQLRHSAPRTPVGATRQA